MFCFPSWMGQRIYQIKIARDVMMYDCIKDYVDDLVVKSRHKENHLKDLRREFEPCWRYSFKMNPVKCSFKITFREFLDFVLITWALKMVKLKRMAFRNVATTNT